MQHGHSQTDEGKEAQAGGNLQLTVAPADGQELTAGGKEQEDEDAKERYCCCNCTRGSALVDTTCASPGSAANGHRRAREQNRNGHNHQRATR